MSNKQLHTYNDVSVVILAQFDKFSWVKWEAERPMTVLTHSLKPLTQKYSENIYLVERNGERFLTLVPEATDNVLKFERFETEY